MSPVTLVRTCPTVGSSRTFGPQQVRDSGESAPRDQPASQAENRGERVSASVTAGKVDGGRNEPAIWRRAARSPASQNDLALAMAEC